MWFFSQGLILEIIQVIVMPWELAIHRSCRFIVSPWISPAWIRTFLYKSFKVMVLSEGFTPSSIKNFLTMNFSCVAFEVPGEVGIRRSYRFVFSPWISPVWVRTSLCESCLKLIHVVFWPGIDPWDDSCDCYAMGTCHSEDLQVHSIPMNFACMN